MRLLAVALAALLLAGCTSPPPGPAPPSTPPGPVGTPRPAAGFNPLVRLGTDMGDIWVEVFEEMVPLTAGNFLTYARNGFYEGIKVHRVAGPAVRPPDGFVIQMGDPNTRDPTKPRSTWGQGDPNLPEIQDEYHPALRHDAAGVVSMATAGPNTGTSQFFITLAPVPALDDKHAVFGRVAAGMDKVRAIGNVSVQGQTPVADITIRSTEVVPAARNASEVRHGFAAWTYAPVANTTANHTITHGIVLQNTGNVRASPRLNISVPPNWSAGAVWPPALDIPAGMGQVVVLAITPPPDTPPGPYSLSAQVYTDAAEAAVPLTVRVRELGVQALKGAPVTVHYTGTMPDGRLFDADRWELVSNASIPKFTGAGQVPGEFTPRPQAGYTPLPFTVGAPGLIEGFQDGVFRLREGEARIVVVPPEKAYGIAGQHALSGRTLLFTIELLKVG